MITWWGPRPANQPASKQASLPDFFLSFTSVGSILQGLCFFPPSHHTYYLQHKTSPRGEHCYPLTKRHFNLTWPNPGKKTLKTRASPKAASAVCFDCPAGRLLLPLCCLCSVVVFCCAVPLRPSLLFYSQCVALQTLVSATSGRAGGGRGGGAEE